MDPRVKVIWKSLLITVLIFGFAILLNHFLDFLRIDVISEVMAEHELDRDAYLTQQSFIEAFSDYGCGALKVRFDVLKQEIKDVGTELGTYSRFSIFKKKDFDYLKRKYFLLEFEFLTLVNKINDMCGNPYLPILFFYEIDDDASERQGFILDDVSKNFDERVVVLSIDKDYDDEPLVNTVIDVFNVTKAPTLIIGDKKFEGLMYTSELNATIKKALSPADPYGRKKDLDFSIHATNSDRSFLTDSYFDRLEKEKDPFTKAELLFIIGRISKNNSMICSALKDFDGVDTANAEELALAYETIASIDCGRNKAAFYALAAKEWEKIGKKWRADIDYILAEGDMPRLKFNISGVQPKLKKGNYTKLFLGDSQLTVYDKTKIVSQTDRVSRDWLSGNIQNPFSDNILDIFSEILVEKKKMLNEMLFYGWHEGGRVRDLLKVGAKHEIASGTLIAKKNGKWFAPDEKGVFRFEVPFDKVLYPTTRFLRDNLAVIIDTHGVNMLVDQAVSKNATLVIGCCDHPAKIAAAKYLSDKGIDVACFTDKYLHLLLGHNASVVGSPPLDRHDDVIVLGERPMLITIDDKIIVSNSSNNMFALWYYQTPANYFKTLSKFIPLDITYYSINNFKDQENLVNLARKEDADFIATRVYEKEDYFAVKEWLEEDPNHKAILFHSSAYPYGLKLFQDFPEKTSFNDPNPALR